LDDYKFAREESEAVELVKLLARLYKSDDETKQVVAPWIEDIFIASGRAAYERWDDLAEKLAKKNLLRDFVQTVYDKNKNIPQAAFLKKLLKQKYDLGDDEEAPAYDPWEFVGLFDRSTERDLLEKGLVLLTKLPFPPIVIGILRSVLTSMSTSF